MTTTSQLESLFFAALEKPPAERVAFLDEACGNDAELRGRLDRMISAHRDAGSFLQKPAFEGDAAVLRESPLAEGPGTVIGPYKLLQQIGEGGMGVVFMAEQAEPLRRTVALKIIKPGMDTRQVIARFEAERQALAMMDHLHIAKVFDAGATSSGRPYFVMELVKGLPITTYCDENRLPLRNRLALFAAVCQAVQHAHQKGIIHRDIKPTNVLVAEYDHEPIPKVIDFGVAKATAQKLTERTMFTEFGQLLGTLEYMSPEQAKLNQLDVDTRSDVYSLGVLLYELLAGSTPLEGERLHEAAFDEMLRIIREEEPPKPSVRLSATNELASIAANRGLEPLKLNRSVQGELDWIVMKALEKDRNLRYESASAFAADVDRYLTDEPVQACPPSARYRLRKFTRRNKSAVAIAVLVLLFLAMLGGSIGWALQSRAARIARASGQLELILEEVKRLEAEEKWSEAWAAVRKAEPTLALGEADEAVQERVLQSFADLELVRRLDEIRSRSGTAWGFPTHSWETMEADRKYLAAFRQAEIDVDALPLDETIDRIATRPSIAAALLPALDDWVSVRSAENNEAGTRRLIEVLRAADPDPWRQQMREALVRKDWPALDGLVDSDELEQQSAATLAFLAATLRASGRLAEQRLVLTRAQSKYPADYWINHRLGIDLIWQHSPNDIRHGIGFMRAAVALRPESSHSMMNLGIGFKHLGQLDEAIACYRKAIELRSDNYQSYSNLGNALTEKGLTDEAVAAFEHAIGLAPHNSLILNNLAWLLVNSADATGRNHAKAIELAQRAIQLSPDQANHWNTLGAAQYRAGDWRAAVEALKKSEELSPQRSTTCVNALFLAMAYWRMDERDEALKWHGKAVEWMNKQQTEDSQLRRIRAEAEEVMEISADKSAA